MDKIINGKLIAEQIDQETAKLTHSLKKQNIYPKLAVILVGNDKPSLIYVEKKGQAAKKVGIDFNLYKFDESIATDALQQKIIDILENEGISGMIVQLPLPKHIDTNIILNTVKPEFDVDYLTKINNTKLENGTNEITPPTPGAIMKIIKSIGADPTGKNVVIIGKGALVGRPLSNILRHAGANVTVCDSKTTDIKEKCLQADIIVSGVGKKDLVRGDMIKNGAIVIDAGTVFVDKKLYGDVNMEEALEKASFVTPTPGGVGPITVSMLLWNTAILAQIKTSQQTL